MPKAESNNPQPSNIEIASRLLCTVCFTYFAYNVLRSFLTDRNLPALLLLFTEALTVLLVLTARWSRATNRSLYASTITILASVYFLLIDPSEGMRLVAAPFPAALQLFGILFQIVAKLYLGRSFGLLPANRGIVRSGPYRLVRHPLYFGYFLSHLGFMMAVWSPYNLAVFAFLYFLQALRIREEERLLMQDDEYKSYARTVRYRFIPMLF